MPGTASKPNTSKLRGVSKSRNQKKKNIKCARKMLNQGEKCRDSSPRYQHERLVSGLDSCNDKNCTKQSSRDDLNCDWRTTTPVQGPGAFSTPPNNQLANNVNFSSCGNPNCICYLADADNRENERQANDSASELTWNGGTLLDMGTIACEQQLLRGTTASPTNYDTTNTGFEYKKVTNCDCESQTSLERLVTVDHLNSCEPASGTLDKAFLELVHSFQNLRDHILRCPAMSYGMTLPMVDEMTKDTYFLQNNLKITQAKSDGSVKSSKTKSVKKVNENGEVSTKVKGETINKSGKKQETVTGKKSANKQQSATGLQVKTTEKKPEQRTNLQEKNSANNFGNKSSYCDCRGNNFYDENLLVSRSSSCPPNPTNSNLQGRYPTSYYGNNSMQTYGGESGYFSQRQRSTQRVDDINACCCCQAGNQGGPSNRTGNNASNAHRQTPISQPIPQPIAQPSVQICCKCGAEQQLKVINNQAAENKVKNYQLPSRKCEQIYPGVQKKRHEQRPASQFYGRPTAQPERSSFNTQLKETFVENECNSLLRQYQIPPNPDPEDFQRSIRDLVDESFPTRNISDRQQPKAQPRNTCCCEPITPVEREQMLLNNLLDEYLIDMAMTDCPEQQQPNRTRGHEPQPRSKNYFDSVNRTPFMGAGYPPARPPIPSDQGQQVCCQCENPIPVQQPKEKSNERGPTNTKRIKYKAAQVECPCAESEASPEKTKNNYCNAPQYSGYNVNVSNYLPEDEESEAVYNAPPCTCQVCSAKKPIEKPTKRSEFSQTTNLFSRESLNNMSYEQFISQVDKRRMRPNAVCPTISTYKADFTPPNLRREHREYRLRGPPAYTSPDRRPVTAQKRVCVCQREVGTDMLYDPHTDTFPAGTSAVYSQRPKPPVMDTFSSTSTSIYSQRPETSGYGGFPSTSTSASSQRPEPYRYGEYPPESSAVYDRRPEPYGLTPTNRRTCSCSPKFPSLPMSASDQQQQKIYSKYPESPYYPTSPAYDTDIPSYQEPEKQAEYPQQPFSEAEFLQQPIPQTVEEEILTESSRRSTTKYPDGSISISTERRVSTEIKASQEIKLDPNLPLSGQPRFPTFEFDQQDLEVYPSQPEHFDSLKPEELEIYPIPPDSYDQKDQEIYPLEPEAYDQEGQETYPISPTFETEPDVPAFTGQPEFEGEFPFDEKAEQQAEFSEQPDLEDLLQPPSQKQSVDFESTQKFSLAEPQPDEEQFSLEPSKSYIITGVDRKVSITTERRISADATETPLPEMKTISEENLLDPNFPLVETFKPKTPSVISSKAEELDSKRPTRTTIETVEQKYTMQVSPDRPLSVQRETIITEKHFEDTSKLSVQRSVTGIVEKPDTVPIQPEPITADVPALKESEIGAPEMAKVIETQQPPLAETEKPGTLSAAPSFHVPPLERSSNIDTFEPKEGQMLQIPSATSEGEPTKTDFTPMQSLADLKEVVAAKEEEPAPKTPQRRSSSKIERVTITQREQSIRIEEKPRVSFGPADSDQLKTDSPSVTEIVMEEKRVTRSIVDTQEEKKEAVEEPKQPADADAGIVAKLEPEAKEEKTPSIIVAVKEEEKAEEKEAEKEEKKEEDKSAEKEDTDTVAIPEIEPEEKWFDTEELSEIDTEQPSPAADAEETEAPKGEAPEAEAPEAEAPEAEAPEAEAPEGEAPEGEAPEGEAPEGEVREGEAPEGEAAADEVPADEAPEGEVPADEVPADEAPEEDTVKDEPADVETEAPESETLTKDEAAEGEIEQLEKPEIAFDSVAEEIMTDTSSDHSDVPAEVIDLDENAGSALNMNLLNSMEQLINDVNIIISLDKSLEDLPPLDMLIPLSLQSIGESGEGRKRSKDESEEASSVCSLEEFLKVAPPRICEKCGRRKKPKDDEKPDRPPPEVVHCRKRHHHHHGHRCHSYKHRSDQPTRTPHSHSKKDGQQQQRAIASNVDLASVAHEVQQYRTKDYKQMPQTSQMVSDNYRQQVEQHQPMINPIPNESNLRHPCKIHLTHEEDKCPNRFQCSHAQPHAQGTHHHRHHANDNTHHAHGTRHHAEHVPHARGIPHVHHNVDLHAPGAPNTPTTNAHSTHGARHRSSAASDKQRASHKPSNKDPHS